MEIRRIACIGAGFAGGSTMAVIAHKCPSISVTVYDLDSSKIALWNSETLHVYEPELLELVASCRNTNLFFTTEFSAVLDADLIFLAVNTPTKTRGYGAGLACDLSNFEKAARALASGLSTSTATKIIVEKSTVPVHTADMIKEIFSVNCPSLKFSVLSNPEFLAEGTAVRDLLAPDRILIGGDNEAVELLVGVYHWVPDELILRTSLWSSELSKLCANSMLAQRISSINSFSAICECTGADIDEVARVVGADQRIGNRFLKPSIGFGGSCLKKDTLCLVYICEYLGLYQVADYWKMVISMNEWQRNRFCKRIVNTMMNTVKDKHICLLGFAYKSNTSDVRESPALYVAKALLDEGAILHIYDPKTTQEAILQEMNSHRFLEGTADRCLLTHKCPYEAAEGTHAIVVLTEWDEFRELDYSRIYNKMKKPAFLFDGRNLLCHRELETIGFAISAIGKSNYCLH